MVIFQSMPMISMVTTFVTLILIWISTLKNPFKAFWALGKQFIASRKFLFLVIAMIGVLLINSWELQWEQAMDYNVDFTPLIYNLEGHFIQNFQQLFHSQWLNIICAIFYVIVFQGLIIASLAVYASDNNKISMYATCCTVMINYMVAIPFYLFVPVHEVWSYAPSGSIFYMLEVFPKFNEVYRQFSGIDNCFPSLHTSISVSMAILGFRSGNKIWKIITMISAVIIMFSTLYFAIHWVSDMVAGLILASVATTLGTRWATRIHQGKAISPSLSQ
ncbi:phosphatase PAP2 family protein [Paenibacillus turicensis]|uniref:phosphatase PAP2 family protein n=1 Tax=Paenibacillus turicensis TaxID=160487 RepID=UPI003D2781D7